MLKWFTSHLTAVNEAQIWSQQLLVVYLSVLPTVISGSMYLWSHTHTLKKLLEQQQSI
jgi:hypothetical protein